MSSVVSTLVLMTNYLLAKYIYIYNISKEVFRYNGKRQKGNYPTLKVKVI